MTAATMRTHYDPATDRWLVESWLVLTPGQIDAARQHVLRVQRQRWAHMPDGDRRDEVARRGGRSSWALWPLILASCSR